jgi:hypothetical protein
LALAIFGNDLKTTRSRLWCHEFVGKLKPVCRKARHLVPLLLHYFAWPGTVASSKQSVEQPHNPESGRNRQLNAKAFWLEHTVSLMTDRRRSRATR